MKLIIMSLILSGFFPLYAQKTAVLKGKVFNWKNEGYLLTESEQGKLDTLQVLPDGSFRYEIKLDKPVRKKLYLDYLGESHATVPYYLLPGQTLTIRVAGERADDRWRLIPDYSGKTRPACEYLYLFYGPQNGFFPQMKNEDGSVISFKAYQKILEDYRRQLQTLLKASPERFAAEQMPYMNELLKRFLFAYSERIQRFNADPFADSDFVEYFEQIDLNDPENSLLISHWIKVYNTHYLADSPENEAILFFRTLKEKVRDQQILNTTADSKMRIYLRDNPDETLKEVFAAYKETSTDRKSQEQMQILYDQQMKLMPGAKAVDFEIQTVKGKTLHLQDIIGKGKITYIDFWATWCRGCCMEIPFVEKLVEKYKNNPQIEFISISLDRDLKKWHQKLEKDQPQWVQYVIPDHFDSTFAKEYNVKMIPRFMIFDKEGRIITVNAPRPSDMKIEAYLEKLF